jgi:hypothetical protein
MKAESQDHIAGDCCDPLLEVGQRMAVASRGARCKCRSRTLDVTPSRPATSSSPDKPENDGSENSRSIPTMPRTTRQVQTPPVSDSFTGDSRLRRQFRCIGEPIRRPSCSPLARIEALDRLRAPRMTLPTAIKALFKRRGSVSPCREGLLPLLDGFGLAPPPPLRPLRPTIFPAARGSSRPFADALSPNCRLRSGRSASLARAFGAAPCRLTGACRPPIATGRGPKRWRER